MKRFIRLPSPAMVVALIALFVSMGGVSYGLATGVIDSREIKNRTIQGKDVRNKSLRGNHLKANSVGGGAIKESTLGIVPGSVNAEGIARSAVVNPQGSAIRAKGATSSIRVSQGRYHLTFNRDVTACTYIATVGDEGDGGPGTGIASVAGIPGNGAGVVVRTSNAANGEPQNRSFHLIVSC